LFSSLIILFPQTSLAHPSRTASDGCHYCRTRCDYWGEIWNTRHCHGGSSYASIILNSPTQIPTSTPTNTPTPRPTNTPIPTNTPTLSPTSSPTPTPEVKGEETEVTPTLSQISNGDTQQADDFINTLLIGLTFVGLTVVSGLVATGGIYMLYKGLKSKESGTEE